MLHIDVGEIRSEIIIINFPGDDINDRSNQGDVQTYQKGLSKFYYSAIIFVSVLFNCKEDRGKSNEHTDVSI